MEEDVVHEAAREDAELVEEAVASAGAEHRSEVVLCVVVCREDVVL